MVLQRLPEAEDREQLGLKSVERRAEVSVLMVPFDHACAGLLLRGRHQFSVRAARLRAAVAPDYFAIQRSCPPHPRHLRHGVSRF